VGRGRHVLFLTLLAALVVASGAGARGAHKGPPSKYWHRCRSYIVSGPVHLTGYTYVKLDRSGNAPVTQHFVRVRNLNILGWVGDIAVDGYEHPRLWLPPGKSHWAQSRILILPPHRKRVGFSIDIDPISDATSLAVELWAARCRP
jgi:hypothetical protein